MDAVTNNAPVGLNNPAGSNEIDLATLMMSVMGERAAILDSTVRERANNIKMKNTQLQNLNAAMSVVNAQSQNDDVQFDNKTVNVIDPATGKSSTVNVIQYLKDKGVTVNEPDDSDGEYEKEEVQILVSNIKNSIDSLTSTSQLEMTELQSTMNKYNQTFEALSNFVSKYFQSLNTITGNMR